MQEKLLKPYWQGYLQFYFVFVKPNSDDSC